MTVRRTARPGAALALGAALLASALPAAASTGAGDGLWYITETGIDEAHAQTTGEGITIAVIDGPVNPAAPDLVGANVVVRPSFCGAPDGVTPSETSTGPDAEHATGTVALLVGTGAGAGGQPGIRGVAPGATVLTYSMHAPGWQEGDLDGPACLGSAGYVDDLAPVAESIDDAVAQGADIISMSSGSAWNNTIGEAVARAYAAGVVIVAAPGNDGVIGWPGSGNGVVMVEMSDSALQLDPETDTTSSPYLAVVAPGEDIRWYDAAAGSWDSYRLASGTSMAAPWTAGAIALAWSQHPDATGNQMMQALIRNTAIENPDLEHHPQWGYGPVAILKLLEADPTQYPDENPFLRPLDDPGTVVPTTQQVLDAIAAASPQATAEPSETPTAEATAAPRPDPDADGVGSGAGPALPIVLGGVGVVAVAAVVLLARRRAASAAPAAGREP